MASRKFPRAPDRLSITTQLGRQDGRGSFPSDLGHPHGSRFLEWPSVETDALGQNCR